MIKRHVSVSVCLQCCFSFISHDYIFSNLSEQWRRDLQGVRRGRGARTAAFYEI